MEDKKAKITEISKKITDYVNDLLREEYEIFKGAEIELKFDGATAQLSLENKIEEVEEDDNPFGFDADAEPFNFDIVDAILEKENNKTWQRTKKEHPAFIEFLKAAKSEKDDRISFDFDALTDFLDDYMKKVIFKKA